MSHAPRVEVEGLVVRRMNLLISQVKDAFPKSTKQKIAERIGLSPSMLSKIVGGSKKHLEDDTIATVVQRMRLDPAFFFDPELDAPDHRDFVRSRSSEPPGDPPHWADFAANWHRFQELTPSEREGLRRMISDRHQIANWTDWIAPAEWILGRRRR